MLKVFKGGGIRKGMSRASEWGMGEEPVKCTEQVTAVGHEGCLLLKTLRNDTEHISVILQKGKTGLAVHQL